MKTLIISDLFMLQMNKSLGELMSAVSQLSALYRTADAPTNHRDHNMVFLSQVDLHPYLQSEEKFTQELTAFTKKQFFEVLMIGHIGYIAI